MTHCRYNMPEKRRQYTKEQIEKIRKYQEAVEKAEEERLERIREKKMKRKLDWEKDKFLYYD